MTTPQHYVTLGLSDLVTDRPFTNPERSVEDAENLNYMLGRLRHLLQNPAKLPQQPRPLVLNLLEGDSAAPLPNDLENRSTIKEGDSAAPLPNDLENRFTIRGKRHRIALFRIDELLNGNDLIVVGFCGHRRPTSDRLIVDTIDQELIAEFPQHPHFLSYSSLELLGGNWCNLVLFNHPEGPEQWRSSTRHWHAVREVAPQYYETVRLHNGVVAGGLMSGNDLILLRTKYYDFQDPSSWRGQREFYAP